jgi:ribosomal protein S18 acetylase RimI-like enzyme
MDFTITQGFSDTERSVVAKLYWEAFSAKLGRVMGPRRKALKFLEAQLNPNFALVGRDPQGTILGVAGFKTAEGALIGGEMADLARVYGWMSTFWRTPILALVERDLADDVLLMDGICVASQARGMGMGGALLDAVIKEARTRNLGSVRLDVINTNPRAKVLYERKGFQSIGEEHLGPFSLIFGFKSATKMVRPLNASAA